MIISIYYLQRRLSKTFYVSISIYVFHDFVMKYFSHTTDAGFTYEYLNRLFKSTIRTLINRIKQFIN